MAETARAGVPVSALLANMEEGRKSAMSVKPPAKNLGAVITQADIQAMAKEAWDVLLGGQLVVAAGPLPDGEMETMTGSIHLGGEYRASIVLKCPMPFAGMIAAAMFGDDAARHRIEDQRDALGEMANVIAGNLKALVPGATTLSLPVVAHGTSYTFRVFGSHEVHRCHFTWQDSWLEVLLLARDQAGT
jgi:CheY-specific phosphatase CheX